MDVEKQGNGMTDSLANLAKESNAEAGTGSTIGVCAGCSGDWDITARVGGLGDSTEGWLGEPKVGQRDSIQV